MDEVIPGVLHWQARHPRIGSGDPVPSGGKALLRDFVESRR